MTLFRKFVIASAVTMASFIALYSAAFSYQFGAPIPSSYDLANWLVLKENFANEAKGHRVLLFGDSNVLFGMDSETIEKRLDMPVVNLGLHGGLPLDWHLDVALRTARSGDVVIFPFVWDYYLKDYRVPQDWIVDQIVAWGHGYFEGLSISNKVRYITAISPSSLYRNVNAKFDSVEILRQNPLRVLLPPKEALEFLRKVSNDQTEFSYQYVNISTHGDIRNTCGKRASIYGSEYSASRYSTVDPTSIALLKQAVDTLKARGASVFVIAPVQVDDDATRSEKYQSLLSYIWGELESRGIPVIGSPTDFFFPASSFFDTNYHLNCSANQDRSERLSKLVGAALLRSSGKRSLAE